MANWYSTKSTFLLLIKFLGCYSININRNNLKHLSISYILAYKKHFII
jgi:hypothetical protein